MAELRVGVYHLEFDDSEPAPGFLELIKKVEATPPRSRCLTIRSNPVRPRHLEKQREYCLVDFSRIQDVDGLDLSDAAGKEDSIEFKPGSPKPSDRTAVVIDHHCNVMYLHEHSNNGLSAANIAQYFREVAGVRKMVARTILNTEAMLRFQKQKRYTALRVAVAGIPNGNVLRERGLSRSAAADMIDQYNSPNLKFEVSLERGDEGTVDSPSVLEAVSVFIGLEPKHLKKLQVVGSEAPGLPDFPVDFIWDRIRFSLEVELAKGIRARDADRYRAVTAAWREHHAEMRKRYARGS